MRQLLLLLLAAALVAACTQAEPTGGEAPTLNDPTAEGAALVERFFRLIQENDVDGLRDFLAPGFQIARADGSGHAKDDYLTRLPTVETYQISELTASQSGSALVVRYMATVSGTVEGRPFSPGPAPRLTMFVWNGSAWLLTAHANFNPLEG